MDNNLNEILLKYELVSDKNYKNLRSAQLNHIIELSNTQADPILIKGMLKLIHDTDKWAKDFISAKKRKEETQNGKRN